MHDGWQLVGISLLTLVPGVVGGSETYARALTSALAKVGELQYRVFLPTVAPDAHGGLPSHIVSAYPASSSMAGRIRAMAAAALFPGTIRRELELDRLSAIHFPLTVMLPTVDHTPAVTTILDVAHEIMPSAFSRAERAYRNVAYGRTARRSRLVIAISAHVRDTLVEHLSIAPERVRVIHLGVDHDRYRPTPLERQPFLVYPANGWPHKNHKRLLEAFSLVRRERPELKLVLTGVGLDRLPLADGVETLGRVAGDRLVELYGTASALVFPSLYEGFGLPILEAMASGCPVACSNAAALPEICGESAVLFDPRSVENMAAGIVTALTRADELSALGMERAKDYTWARCAEQHESAYRDVLEWPRA